MPSLKFLLLSSVCLFICNICNNNHSFPEQQLENQFSTASLSAPPTYDEANRVLGPDIAPLPKIDSITPEVPVEGEISA